MGKIKDTKNVMFTLLWWQKMIELSGWFIIYNAWRGRDINQKKKKYFILETLIRKI